VRTAWGKRTVTATRFEDMDAAERARYGVFRQAAFGTRLEPALVERLLASASGLRDAINRQERQVA
jgi:hypothetical protein